MRARRAAARLLAGGRRRRRRRRLLAQLAHLSLGGLARGALVREEDDGGEREDGDSEE